MSWSDKFDLSFLIVEIHWSVWIMLLNAWRICEVEFEINLMSILMVESMDNLNCRTFDSIERRPCKYFESIEFETIRNRSERIEWEKRESPTTDHHQLCYSENQKKNKSRFFFSFQIDSFLFSNFTSCFFNNFSWLNCLRRRFSWIFRRFSSFLKFQMSLSIFQSIIQLVMWLDTRSYDSLSVKLIYFYVETWTKTFLHLIRTPDDYFSQRK